MAKNNGLSFYKKRRKVTVTILKEVFSWVFGILLSIVIACVFNYYFGMMTNVVGESMEDTLSNGQTVFVNRFHYMLFKPKQGDVVVFLPNGNVNTHYYVKRVLAVPGDKVLITSGILFINGEACGFYDERILDAGIAVNEFVLGEDEYFCMGDNPNNSEDSRSPNIGPVKRDDMIGKAWFHLKSGTDGIGFVKSGQKERS